MRKVLAYVVFFLSCASGAFAQFTTVTATITDSDSTTWINENWSVQFVPAPGYPNLNEYTVNGTNLTSPTYASYINQTGVANASGVISVTLLDNNVVLPKGSTWRFVVQSQTSAPAMTYNPTTVTGASQSLSSFLSTNSIAPRFPAIGNASFGYADVEVSVTPLPGGYYYNTGTTTPGQRVWNGTAWTAAGGASLPTATASGQIVTSTGPGTTYIASNNPSLLNFPNYASTTTPLYLESHFRDDTQRLFFAYSSDAANYVQLYSSPLSSMLPTGGIRDISAMYVPAQSKFYFVGTCCNNGTFAYFTSTDLKTFTGYTGITAPGVSTTYNWSPRLLQDPNNLSNYYAVVGGCASTCISGPTAFYIATFNPATGAFGTFNQITLNGETGYQALFDMRITYNSSTGLYYAVYAWATYGPQVEYLHIATASSISGPYTRINSGTTDYFGAGTPAENPDIIVLPNGNLRVAFDSINNYSTAGTAYSTREYVDNSPAFAGVLTTPALVSGPLEEGGSNITITTPAASNVVYNVAATQASTINSFLGQVGINGPPNNPYTMFIWNYADSSFPSAFNTLGLKAFAFQNYNNSLSVLTATGAAGGFNIGNTLDDATGNLGLNTVYLAGSPAGTLPLFQWYNGSFSGNGYTYLKDVTNTITAASFISSPYSTDAPGEKIPTNGCYGWTNDNAGSSLAQSFLCQPAAGVATIGTTKNTANGSFKAAAYTVAGTTFAVAGCGTATSLVGGSTAGKFVGGSSTCSPVITMGGSFAAPNGFACFIQDETTSTAVFRQTAYNTTTATFTGSGTIGGTDTLVFGCDPF